MKKPLKFILNLTVFAMIAGAGVGLATRLDGNQVAKQAAAATENKDCITFTLEDQVGGTSDGRNPILHFWDITVDSSMGYAASPGADLTAAGFVNDLETGSTAGSNAFDGTNADSGFDWASESGGKRYWTIHLPWYVTGCQFTIKHGDYWSHTNLTVSGSGSYMIYMFNYWSYTELSIGAKGSSGESHVQAAEKYAISATANPSVGGTATVKGNGGSAVASGNYFKRQKITAKATANSGYSFGSWSDSGTAEHTFYASKDVALTANFTANTYTVNYNKGTYGTGDNDSATKTYNVPLTLPGVMFTREGYTQEGWSTSPAGTTKDYELQGSYTENKGTTLYPYWKEATKPTYQIRWIDGDNNVLSTQSVEEGTTPSYTGAAPTKTSTAQYSYTWNNTWNPTPYAANKAQDYVAQFDSTVNQYTITFKDGDGNTIQEGKLNYGAIPSYTGPAPTKTATAQYTYTWNNGWTPTISSVTGNQTYTATFNSTVNQYTITWNTNGGTITSDPSDYTTTADYGTTIVAPTVEKDGYTFTGWNPNLQAGTKVTGNATYTAQWQREDGKYIHVFGTNERYIKMSINGSSTTEYVATVSLTKSEAFKITSLDSGDESGWYGFSNLKYDTGDGPHVDARSTAQIIDDGTNDHNMKANLAGTNTYTVYFDTKSSKIDDQDGFHTYIPSIVNVEFDLNGKTGTGPDNQIVNARGLVTEPEDPEAIGYSFEGWYSDAACTQAWDFSTCQVIYFSKDDTTHVCTQKIYAKWVSTAVVDITLNKNGGTGGAEVIEDVKVGDEISLTKEELPTKLNNSFTGYFTTGGTQVIDKDGNNVVPYEESFGTTLNAGWQINSGTYLAFSSEEMARDGSHPMSQNGDKTDEFVIKNVSLSKNDYFKVYYVDDYGNVKWQGDGGEGDPTVITTHPDYTAVIDESKNVKITTDNDTALTYDLYFNTTTRTYTVQYTGVPTAGFYVVKNGDTSVNGLSDKRAIEWTGWTGTEYKVTVSFEEGDLLSLYHQSSSDVGEYNPILNESVNVWETDPTTGKLVCPASGTYTFYIITKDGGKNYNYVSIFKEGEAEAIEFARAFNTAIGSVCKMDGSTDLGKLNDAWTAQATAFSKLTPETAKTLLSLVSSADANSDLKAFAEKYDYVYSHHGANLTSGNFAGRNVSPMRPLYFAGLFTDITNGTNSPTLIGIITSIVVGVAVGGYFLLRKKKED